MAVNLQDIREWGKANGYSVEDTGKLPTGLRQAYRVAHDDDVETGTTAEELPSAGLGPEVAPRLRVPRPSVAERARDLASRARELPRKASPVKAGTSSKPRIAIDRIVERGWEFLARTVQPVNLPVARVLAVQAPVAGLILEDVIKGTVVDRLLQPLARAEEKGEILFALIGPPLLMGALTVKPEMQSVLVPLLKESLRVWIDVAGPKLEIAEKRNKAFEEKYGQRIDDMISMFLAPPVDSGVDATVG